MLFNASKTQFLHLSIRQNLPDNYPIYFDDTNLSLSFILNILGLSFTKTRNWKFHISSLAKSASKKLGVLCHLHQFFSPYQLLSLYRDLICPCIGRILFLCIAFHVFFMLCNQQLKLPPCRRPRVLFSLPWAITLYTHSLTLYFCKLPSVHCIYPFTVIMQKDLHLLRRIPCPKAHDKDVGNHYGRVHTSVNYRTPEHAERKRKEGYFIP